MSPKNNPNKVSLIEDSTSKIGSFFSDASFLKPEYISPSAWLEHAPFAFWLIDALKPNMLVELGTHWGYSYFSLCQGISWSGTYCQAYAVDTWAGDEHSGFYDESVWQRVSGWNSAKYSQFSKLMRMDFSQALEYFSDKSIDLLHIDGRHLYEDVKSDFETWAPKLSDRSVVIFHDISVRERNFGVFKFWEELRAKYPSFEFSHNNGLGVLAFGKHVPDAVLSLLSLGRTSELAAVVRSTYASLGADIIPLYQIQDLQGVLDRSHMDWNVQKTHLEAEISRTRDASQDVIAQEKAKFEALIRGKEAEFAAELQAIEDRYNVEKEEYDIKLATYRQSLGELQERLIEAERAAHDDKGFKEELAKLLRIEQDSRLTLARAVQKSQSTIDELTEKLSKKNHHENIVREKEAFFTERNAFFAEQDALFTKQDAILKQVLKEFAGEQGRYSEGISSLEQYNATLQSTNLNLQHELNAAQLKLKSIEYSTSWRVTKPLRYASQVIQKVVPGANHIASHRQLFGVSATLKRIAGYVTGRKGETPSSYVENFQQAEPVPNAPIIKGDILDLNAFVVANVEPQTPRAVEPTDGNRVEGLCFSAPLTNRKLLYVSGEAHTPGHQYRVVRYMEAAEANGYEVFVVALEELATLQPILHRFACMIVWRAKWNDDLQSAVEEVRRAKGLVVFDVDDLMIDPALAKTEIIDGIRSQFLTEEAVVGHFSGVRQAMLAADVCFAATERLAFHMRQTGKACYVLPNGFDQRTHDRSRDSARKWGLEKSDDFIRIGYAGGSRTHQRDLGLAINATARILREYDYAKLVLFTEESTGRRLIDIEEYPSLNGLEHRIEWRPLQPLVSLPDEMARFDINLAPLEVGNPFCESKSELKFFEAALANVPTIASPTQPFRAAITHGKTGFLAVGPEDWYLYLKMLVDQPELRANVATQAYHASLAKFGPSQRREKFGRTLDSLWGGAVGARAFALETKLVGSRSRLPTVYPSDIVFKKESPLLAEVSVVIPLYNYEGYILETLESIKAQSLECIDLIVVDGHSTDNSLEVALEWIRQNAHRFNRCILIKNQSNYGLAYCRNSGVDATDTPFYIPVDADNKLCPTACEALLQTLKQENCAFAYSTIQQFGATQDLMCALPFDPQRFVPDNFIDAMALVSKEAWAMIGGYDHIRGGWEDYDFWVRMAENGLRGVWHPEVLAEYRVHYQSMMRTQTLIPVNRLRMHDEFKSRHPWVSLGAEQAALNLPSLEDERPGEARMRELLPILRCPKSKQKLLFEAATQTLHGVDGSTHWKVVNGRPILMPHDDIAVMGDDHISNELPEIAIKLIESTPGLVLNLSAGGSAFKHTNVVEVEFAVFRNTDVVADAHALPFEDNSFEAVVSMNAFEHYINPNQVANEIRRILKPGGKVLVRTAFLQPLHEKPWHFYNCTKYGLENWFNQFDISSIEVSENFNPVHTLAWVTSELENGLRSDASAAAADYFRSATVGEVVDMWRSNTERETSLWTNFQLLSQDKQEVTAAGFELIAQKPKFDPI
jgi:glycosyltransferase involved in cell wall biosynthesis/SAM-dependent methyltransferase